MCVLHGSQLVDRIVYNSTAQATLVEWCKRLGVVQGIPEHRFSANSVELALRQWVGFHETHGGADAADMSETAANRLTLLLL